MFRVKIFVAALAIQAAILFFVVPPSSHAAETSAFAALSGLVSSHEEGSMEGVLVTAKKDGSTIAVTVVSDNQGHYAFPSGRLDAGNYRIKIRAVGYDLADPGEVK